MFCAGKPDVDFHHRMREQFAGVEVGGDLNEH
jgi:hypothetical protein